MPPAQNLLRRHYDSYVGHLGDAHLQFQQQMPPAMPILMADDADPKPQVEAEEEEQVAGSSSVLPGSRQGWLQLGIGLNNHMISSSWMTTDAPPVRERAEMVELNLFPERPPDPLPTQRQPLPMPLEVAAGGSGSSYPGPGLGTYRPREGSWVLRSGNMAKMVDCNNSRPVSAATSSGDGGFRVINPPSRQHTGLWFLLRAAQNQRKEPFLPQIPKSYLRIKDVGMTIMLLIKYLANKLALDDESEVEISCRGQQVPHSWTLKQVRDRVWNCREAATLLPESSCATDHLMILEYSRA